VHRNERIRGWAIRTGGGNELRLEKVKITTLKGVYLALHWNWEAAKGIG
jgi:hypothetical protein